MMQRQYLTLDAVAIDIVAHMKACNADYEHYRRMRALGAMQQCNEAMRDMADCLNDLGYNGKETMTKVILNQI